MPDFLRNLVLRGSGASLPGEARPTHQPQFPPDLRPEGWQTPLLFSRAISSTEAPAPSQMDRSSPAGERLPARQAASPATLIGPPPAPSAPHKPDQPPQIPASPPDTRSERQPQMEISPAESDRPYAGNHPVESGQLVGQVEEPEHAEAPLAAAMSPLATGEPAVDMAPPLRPPLPTARIVEPMETPQATFSPITVDRPRPEVKPAASRRRLDRAEPPAPSGVHSSAQALSPPTASPAMAHDPAPIVQPVLPASRPVLVEPGMDSPVKDLRIQPVLPVAANPVRPLPSSIEVHIGTLEVRANPPPPSPPPPKPQGFEDYAHLRGWDGG